MKNGIGREEGITYLRSSIIKSAEEPLVEDHFQHGFLVTGDGTRHRIDNSPELRAWVMGMAGQIQAARAAVAVPIAVDPSPGQCRACAQRGNCGQARL